MAINFNTKLAEMLQTKVLYIKHEKSVKTCELPMLLFASFCYLISGYGYGYMMMSIIKE